MASCIEVEELLGSYALGALPREALEEVEEHLGACGVCQSRAREMLRTASTLRLGVPQVDPPRALHDRILGAVRNPHEHGTGAPEDGRSLLVQLPVRRRRVAGPAYWAGAAALVLMFLSGWLGLQVIALQQSVATTEESARQAWAEAEVAADTIARWNQAGAAGAAHIDGTEMAPGAWGTLYYVPSQQDGVLLVGGLPNLPKDKCYQLWLIRGDRWMNGGTFYVENDGKSVVVVKSPMPMASIDTIRVTMEPHGGSAEPRGDRYMWARLGSS
ncbi:MAG TPA: anti-sigma factor [Chloroflexota bacterium]|nr:anti-sigma factor [Chloroflexota bacterium]